VEEGSERMNMNEGKKKQGERYIKKLCSACKIKTGHWSSDGRVQTSCFNEKFDRSSGNYREK